MKLAVFGATGQTGIQIVGQALAAGHEVTAVVRDPAKLGDFRMKVRMVKGDPIEARVVADAVAGADAVLSALGHGRNSPPDMLSKFARSAVGAMKEQNVHRLIVLTNVAARDPTDRPSLYNQFLRTLLTLFAGGMSRDTAEEARIISESGLDWTIVRANLLTNGPLTKRYKAGAFDPSAKARVSRADVADFMLSCAMENKFVRAKPLISG